MDGNQPVLAKASARRPIRPRWSLKSSFYTAIGIVLLVTPLVLLTVRDSVWTEVEVLTGAVFTIMFVYLTVVLFLGVRFDKTESFAIQWPKGRPTDVVLEPGGFCGWFTQLGAEAGILGALVGVVLDILATFVLAFAVSFVIWIGFNGILAAILAVCIPLFFFYRRALRSIVTKGRRCRGNIRASLFQSFKSTLGYAVWFYGIFLLAQYVERVRLN
jgi:hypothetical protein